MKRRRGSMSIELGRKLAALRKQNDITQKQIAEILHINRATYAYYERGDTEPDLKTLVRLSRMFGVEPSFFLPDMDSPRTMVAATDKDEIDKSATRTSSRTGGTFSMNAEVKSMLLIFRSLDGKYRTEVCDFARDLAAKLTAEKNTDRPAKK